MSARPRIPIRRLRRHHLGVMLFAATALVLLVLTEPARAAEIEVDAPSESTVGEVVRISATITDGGSPVPDAQVAVARQASIGGVSGFAELDRGVTDAAGQVTLEFVQYADSSGPMQLRIEYEGPDGVETAEFELAVQPGPQQYVSESGADVGILNVSWLVVLLGLVWALLIIATAQVVIISRARRRAARGQQFVTYAMVGFVAFTAIGMFIVVLTQPTTHANLAPGDEFDRVPTAMVGEPSAYHGIAAPDRTGRPDDVTGEELYVGTGCASCHGLGGEGAVVGGALPGSLVSDTDEVVEAIRRGPGGMPTYDELVLSDEEIDRIIEYLLEVDDG